MNSNDGILRIAAVAAVVGAVVQLVASVLEPDLGGDPRRLIRVVADNGFWIGDRLLHLVGLFLAVGAFTVVGHTFAEGPGSSGPVSASPFSFSWARSERAGSSPVP